MSDTEAPANGRPWWRMRWTSALLIASLALNVFILGAVGARFVMGPPHERYVGLTYAQLVPRGFLADLDRQRRDELLGVLRKYGQDFRDARLAARKVQIELATALETEPYDAKLSEAAIHAYAASGDLLVNHGRRAALDFIGMLTPEERKDMAAYLRRRADFKHRD